MTGEFGRKYLNLDSCIIVSFCFVRKYCPLVSFLHINISLKYNIELKMIDLLSEGLDIGVRDRLSEN